MFDVMPLDGGWYLVSDGRQQWRVAVATGAEGTWVFADGHAHRLDHVATGRTRARARNDGGVMAPMPATVVTLNAQPGDRVTEGDVILVLEAMKMELPIRAPRSGAVKAVHCATGDLVQPGVNLVEIE